MNSSELISKTKVPNYFNNTKVTNQYLHLKSSVLGEKSFHDESDFLQIFDNDVLSLFLHASHWMMEHSHCHHSFLKQHLNVHFEGKKINETERPVILKFHTILPTIQTSVSFLTCLHLKPM